MPPAGAYSARPDQAQSELSATSNMERLFRDGYPVLAGWVRRLVDNDDTAHEIASESFARLLARLTRPENPRGYLYMIAANLVTDHWRKAERERRAIGRLTTGAERKAVIRPGQDVEVRDLLQCLPPRL